MSRNQTDSRKAVPGFWERLAFALEPLGCSSQEPLERRIRQLEAEVARLSEYQSKPAKS